MRSIQIIVLTLISMSFGDSTSVSAGPYPAVPVAVVGPEERGAKQPQAAVDGEGRIFVTFGVEDTIRCATSIDGGKTFRVATVGSAGRLALGMRRGPRIAVAGRTLVVTAVVGAMGKGRDGDLMAWRSIDQGTSWTGPTQVNTVDGSAREGLHGMAGAVDGSLYCVWLDLRSQKTELFGARSNNGGMSWEADHLVYRSPDGSICECCHPSVSFATNGTLHVMWRNSLDGARDLYVTHSKNGGKTFGNAEKLGKETWLLKACPMDGGAIAVGTQGRVETVWMREGAIYAATPGHPERKLGPGLQGWGAAGAGGPVAAWLAQRSGPLMVQLPTERDPIVLSAEARDPMVASDPAGRGPVVVVWEAKPENGGILAAVLTPSSDKSSLEASPNK